MRGTFPGKTSILRSGGMGIAGVGGSLILTGFAPGISALFPGYLPPLAAILGIFLLIGGMGISNR